ncbi:type II toxin-antitoxin system VapC family toxin [Caulobacter sp. UNC279MFTsu5.1]|uniref:type II toxin-antitoxin system VapC family toxin n=1 Tax=Caulobacter sp. UNC279MFTsu5.1 TaxID=1502775 RepID=UPI0008E1D24D|nr:type II toxin-antitoxin system VapC family toxin [Caulobacter sp. UNC279MFTsu5.1]SFK47153.1 Predicted nucleic-acid-binding protein, contains PIN domain [Caulobacter sp. UNC279MFTsu5.1]
MRVALDTSIVVRFLTFDDEHQALAARRLVEDASEIVIPAIVLCETAWLLASGYGYSALTLADALRLLIDMQGVKVDRPVVEAGLKMLRAGGDFADGCILFEAERTKCERLATFDKGLVKLSQGRASRP